MNRSESKYFNTAVKMDDALIALLEKKPFEYITVREICEKAGVNRSTFYLHYENTNDLLTEATNRIIDSFLSYFSVDLQVISTRFTDCKSEELNFITPKYLFPYLSYIKDHKKIFSTALSRAKSFEFESIFQRMFDNIFDPILSRFHYPPSDRKYVMMFYLNGVTAIVTEWLKNDCDRPIEDVADIIQNCIFGLGHRNNHG